MGSSQSTTTTSTSAVTSAQLTGFKYIAQYAAAGYCNTDQSLTTGTLITCSNSGCPDVETNKATIYGILDGNDNTGTSGYVGLDPVEQLIVVSFAGTESGVTWLYDVELITTDSELCDGCMIHGGFATPFDDMSYDMLAFVAAAKVAHPTYSVVVTGHSLGGALATLGGATLRAHGYPCDIYTFGSPRVGNEDFAEFVSAQAGNEYRITHLQDPVPRLPSHLLTYRHTDMEYWLSNGDDTTVDYATTDIVICQGTYNANCNGAGSLQTDTTSHSYYLMHISACKA